MGAHVVNQLLDQGNTDIVALDDLSGGFGGNLNPAATFVDGSILDAQLINQLCEQYQFDYIYHLAAYAAEDSAILSNDLITRTTSLGV